MRKRVIYRENGERKVREFDVGGGRRSDGIRVDKDLEVESIVFSKSVEFLMSVYVDGDEK